MKEVIDLGNMPFVNNLKNTKEESLNVKKYPLRVVEDENLMMRLDTIIDPNEMFFEYFYRSGINEPYKQHCRKMWHDITHYVYGVYPYAPLDKEFLIVDVGGNDGTLLSCFKSQANPEMGKISYTNVDASKSFEEENKNQGINYIRGFWGDVTLEKKANVIISTNVFQHNSDVHKFLQGIKNNLDGVWILEFPYFLTTVKTNQFDQIYHEHYYYWLMTPLVKLFKQYGLGILSVSQHSIHGGTMRIVSTNKTGGTPGVETKYLNMEKEFDFSFWAKNIKNKLMTDALFIQNLQGKIACFGAAAKGCVYLNSLGPDVVNNKISYIVDDTLQKQGKYVPGTALKIMNRDYLYQDQPDYVIILAHNFKDAIEKSLRPNYKGKIITMIPDVEISE